MPGRKERIRQSCTSQTNRKPARDESATGACCDIPCRSPETSRRRAGIVNDGPLKWPTPPSLAARPAARCVNEDCPHPGRPRSGCAAGPLAPPGSHGACNVNGVGHGRIRARLHHGSGSPRARSASACPGSAARGVRPWPVATLSGAMSAVRRSRPTARTLRAGGRGAPRQGSSARNRSAGQRGRRGGLATPPGPRRPPEPPTAPTSGTPPSPRGTPCAASPPRGAGPAARAASRASPCRGQPPSEGSS